MSTRHILAAAVVAGLMAVPWAAPASAGDAAPAPLALQAIQAHEFEGSKTEVFSSVMDVLQDAGFTVVSADLNTGFITATSPYGKQGFSIWWGRARGSTRLTAFIETLANGRTRVRLNFTRLTDQLGWSMALEHREKALVEPNIYQAVFEKVDEALFVRKATNTPSTAPAAQAPTPVVQRAAAPAPSPPSPPATATAPAPEAAQPPTRRTKCFRLPTDPSQDQC